MPRLRGYYGGHEKEPPAKHRGKDRMGKPTIHSHSHRPKRMIKGTSLRAKH